jgi:hypothetical protein
MSDDKGGKDSGWDKEPAEKEPKEVKDQEPLEKLNVGQELKDVDKNFPEPTNSPGPKTGQQGDKNINDPGMPGEPVIPNFPQF